MRSPLPILFAAAIALAACSPEIDEPQQGRSVPSRDFTAEDKRVAQALSLGEGALGQASMEGKALLCNLGLEAIRPRLEQSGALTSEQRQAFDRASEIFAKRARDGYHTPARLAEARRGAEIDYPDTSDRARLAIACLRGLM